jgi:formamidopyrimidine-DNA glycosylase
MPELPEVEHLRRTLEPHLRGALVRRVTLRRRDVVRQCDDSGALRRRGPIGPADLLVGSTIRMLDRHGKNLIIRSSVGADDADAPAGPILVVHLGMSGHMQAVAAGQVPLQRDHIHCEWELEREGLVLRLIFRDPRRFGGLWLFADDRCLQEHRLSGLGPDALMATVDDVQPQLGNSHRPIKAALLDQGVIAGVGNIYADEALFAAGISPRRRACRVRTAELDDLLTALRAIMVRAIGSGGSTIRSYIDGNGQSGTFAQTLQVYGRGGEQCPKCHARLTQTTIAQRTTVYCRRCQR